MKKFLSLIVLAALFFAGPAFAADPIVGTWKLNVAKSKFSPGAELTAGSRIYTEAKGVYTLEDRIRRGSVAVYPLGSAVFFEAIVDVGDDPRDQVPLQGFKRIYTSGYYAVYANC